MSDKISVTGIKELQRALKAMDADLPKMMRIVLNDASSIVVRHAEPKIPKLSGRARASVKVRSSQRDARVAVGGTKAPWYPWLDFGGQGRVSGRPGARPFIKRGRYLYPALDVKRDEVVEAMSAGLAQLARDAGLEVT